MPRTLFVKYLPNLDCFARLDLKSCGIDPNVNCLKISWGDKSCLVWCVNYHCEEGHVGFNFTFARRLELDEGTVVYVSPHSPPPVKGRIVIHPDTEEDLEILESNALNVQESLLNQIRVFGKNQQMVLWVSPSLHINITASETCTVQQQTEVIVDFKISNQDNSINKSENDLKEKCDKLSGKSINYYMNDIHSRLSKHYDNKCENLILGRIVLAHKISHLAFKHSIDFEQLFVVFVLNDESILEGIYNFKCMETISESQERNQVPKKVHVYLKKVDKLPCKELKVIDKYIPVVISKELSNILGINMGKKVIMEQLNVDLMEPEIIELSPVFKDNQVSSQEFLDDFKIYVTKYFSKENPLLINNNFIYNLLPYKNLSCQITLYPTEIEFVKLFGELFRRCKVTVKSDLVQPYDFASVIHTDQDVDEMCRNLDSFETVINSCTNILKYNISKEQKIQHHFNKNHILLTGPSGSGKTSLCHAIASDLGIWFTRLECRAIKGRKDILDHFNKILQLCEEYSPSILICDDIDSIIPYLSEEVPQQDVAVYETLTYAVKDCLKNCLGVFLLLTASSMDSINPSFLNSKGDLLIPFHFSIPDLSTDERVELLKYVTFNSLYDTHHIPGHLYHDMAIETDGFTVRDTLDYITKRIFKAVKKAVHHNQKSVEVQTFSNDSIISKFDEEVTIWSELGGMKDIKQSLVEILLWPLKYPVLFPKQPGGILLFGPPGTGKSLLGSCVSKLSQMSFICVKGPELLSKYIGQSEQAVRNLFQKAEKKKPCVLFFDEFDSLAPRRGHDSTGVTDRVVNQLLTQLDGVEGAIKGVTVIAATSRPDLLDGALLRPGRFDITIHCDMPNQDDRLEIFKVLSCGLMLSDNVRLEEFAEMTEGFTGADIKSILSTAQLQCLEEKIQLLEKATLSCSEILPAIEDEHRVTREHLLDALANTRPSLTPQQLKQYETIYSRFLNKPLTEEQKSIKKEMDYRLRATLA